MKRMTINLSTCFLAVDDFDKAIPFYRDVLGLDVRLDVGYEGMRWVTVGSPEQPDVNIVVDCQVDSFWQYHVCSQSVQSVFKIIVLLC